MEMEKFPIEPDNSVRIINEIMHTSKATIVALF